MSGTRTLSIHPDPEHAARSAARDGATVVKDAPGATPERRWAVVAPTKKKDP